MMIKKKGYLEEITQPLAPLGQIKIRTQFGGYSLSVDRAVFAVIAQGGLYLRACEVSQHYLYERKLPPLKLYRRGVPVQLDYYRVDDTLWAEPEQLLAISRLCLEGARTEREEAEREKNIRDLANISPQLERLLREVGINSIPTLHREGAKESWLKLRAVNPHLGINTLYALQGALIGFHYHALPAEVKEELRNWYEETLCKIRQKKYLSPDPGS